MINIIFKFIKKIILSFMLIYAYNSFCIGLGIVIPINVLTLFFVYFFELYGIVGIVILFFII